jgi:hypothetical protein
MVEANHKLNLYDIVNEFQIVIMAVDHKFNIYMKLHMNS